MKTKILLTFLLIGFTSILFSQNTISVNTSWNGKMCNGGHGMCFIDTTSNKATANTQLSFDKENNELTLVISKTDTTSKLKITNTELEKGFYLYNFDESFELPQDVLNSLGIANKTNIKKGNYLVKEKDNSLIMKLKLE